MDYDNTSISAKYDTGRGYSPVAIAFWLDTIESIVGKSRFDDILDLGCGTGRYAEPLAERFDARVVAVDPSSKMLREATRKRGDRVRLVQATGEALPLSDASFDLVFISMAFHHFDDPQRVVRECRRVLRRTGLACLRAATADRIDRYPYLPFFPGSRDLMAANFGNAISIQHAFSRQGFRMKDHRIVEAEIAETWSSYADKVATRTDSILARLPDEAFESGLVALREHARDPAACGPVIEPVDLFVFGPS